MEPLTPRQIVAELDRYIVGQHAAKRAVAVALRNRYRRQQLPPEVRNEILPKNILMIGPTGVGKTEIARRLAQLAGAPFLKVEATKFTEVGYVGRDVESMVRDLVGVAVRMVETEKMDEARPKVAGTVERRLADLILEAEEPQSKARPESRASLRPDREIIRRAMELFGQKLDDGYPDEPTEEDDEEQQMAAETRREEILRRLRAGELEQTEIEVEVEDNPGSFLQIFSPQGLEEMGLELPSDPFHRSKTKRRKATVAEAREILTRQEAAKLLDRSSLYAEAVERTEQTGIIFLDEIDKVASRKEAHGPDVSREGVQRDLLPIIEGSVVRTKYGPVRTDHILFIAAGAFHISKPSDLIPELQGRLPIRVELEPLGEADFRRILREPQNALSKQYQTLLATEGVELEFTEEALDAIAAVAAEVNAKTENIGARRLHTVMERLLEDVLFEAPDLPDKRVRIDADRVRERLQGLVEDVDLSRYIL
ncbi:MAG: ATP-dependent protease ATPase subunit HslU [Fimbriimonadaceae bacterium]